MMAAKTHWVNELFPVKFSLEDLLGDGEAKSSFDQADFNIKDHYQDVCNRVIASIDRPFTEEIPRSGGVNDHDSNERENEVVIRSSDEHGSEVLYSDTRKANATSLNNGCIWTKEELDIFRNGFFHLKKRSVHLLFLLSESKRQIKQLKSKCKEDKATILTQACKLSEQKKQNMKLNVTIKELREDLEFSKEMIQQMLKIETQLREQNKFLKAELEDERNELANVRGICTSLDKKLKKQKNETAFGYMQQENILKAKHMYTVEKLEKENKELKKELDKERNNHRLTKIALEQLRKHFANMERAVSSEHFLDVAEVDNHGLL